MFLSLLSSSSAHRHHKQRHGEEGVQEGSSIMRVADGEEEQAAPVAVSALTKIREKAVAILTEHM